MPAGVTSLNNFTPIQVCNPYFGVVKYSCIQAIVLSFVGQFLTIRYVSEDRKLFEVGEIFHLSLGKLEKWITMITLTRNAPLQDQDF